MNTIEVLNEIKSRLKISCTKDIKKVIEEMKRIAIKDTEYYNILINIDRRLYDLNQDNLKGIIDSNFKNMELSIITSNLLSLIDLMKIENISPQVIQNLAKDKGNTILNEHLPGYNHEEFGNALKTHLKSIFDSIDGNLKLIAVAYSFFNESSTIPVVLTEFSKNEDLRKLNSEQIEVFLMSKNKKLENSVKNFSFVNGNIIEWMKEYLGAIEATTNYLEHPLTSISWFSKLTFWKYFRKTVDSIYDIVVSKYDIGDQEQILEIYQSVKEEINHDFINIDSILLDDFRQHTLLILTNYTEAVSQIYELNIKLNLVVIEYRKKVERLKQTYEKLGI